MRGQSEVGARQAVKTFLGTEVDFLAPSLGLWVWHGYQRRRAHCLVLAMTWEVSHKVGVATVTAAGAATLVGAFSKCIFR